MAFGPGLRLGIGLLLCVVGLRKRDLREGQRKEGENGNGQKSIYCLMRFSMGGGN
jgi:hypothetical protein